MALTIISVFCLLASVWFWHFGWQCKVDASPIGSILLLISIMLAIMSVFLFGIQIGFMLFGATV